MPPSITKPCRDAIYRYRRAEPLRECAKANSPAGLCERFEFVFPCNVIPRDVFYDRVRRHFVRVERDSHRAGGVFVVGLDVFVREAKCANAVAQFAAKLIIAHARHDHRWVTELMAVEREIEWRPASHRSEERRVGK